MKYLLLNVKTGYELLDSLIKEEDLILYARDNGIDAIGITNSNMFNAIEFYNLCNKNNIKPIIGCELVLDNKRFLVYAKNYFGYINLCNIVSKKNIDGICYEYIKNYSSNLKCVCDKCDYDFFKSIFDDVYIGFKTEEEYLYIDKSIKCVFVPEVKYFYESDKEYYKYLRYIKDGKTISDEVSYDDYHIISCNNDDIIKTTYEFIEDIDVVFPPSKLRIPVYREDYKEFFKALCFKGLSKRFNGKVSQVYIDRLNYEMEVIDRMEFINYFLIVYDFVLFAKKNGIMVGPGRGSAAGSLVSYVLGITEIDPLKYDLIFERFLNPERITMPDIDIDFDNMRRDDVTNYVKEKYGFDRVANIITFNTLLPKQIIRDVARVMEISDSRVDRICKYIKLEKNFSELKENKLFMNVINSDDELKKLVRICNRLCGFKRNTSIHAAGVVISDSSLCDIMPLYSSDGNVLTGFTMDYIESMGLLKMDFLSIRNLNTIFNIINDIKQESGEVININKIPLNDDETLKIFEYANTSGIFQFESSGMRNFLRMLKVKSFNDLIDAIALYRPGPREMIGEYISNRSGNKKIKYLIKELEPILSSTYGIMIYQEQVLEILRKIGGYSYAQADVIRRAMSKKKADIIEKEKDNFINGVVNHGYDRSIGEELYNKIIMFSNYGFNKSHSVVYSMVAYQMAYLKSRYSLYFIKSLLNMSINSDIKVKEYIDEARVFKIEFSNISINKSCDKFIIDNKRLVLPFSIIKNIGEAVCNEIITEREKGSFKSLYDFLIRTYGKGINKRVVIALIECGAFNEFGLNKKETIMNIDLVIDYIMLCKDLDESLIPTPVFEEYDDYSDNEMMDIEIKNYGFYLSHHPVCKYDRSNLVNSLSVSNYFNKTIHIILLVESIKTITTKNNEKMSFLTLSDEFGKLEGVLFPNAYNKFFNIEKGKVYAFDANVEKRNNEYQLVVYNVLDM